MYVLGLLGGPSRRTNFAFSTQITTYVVNRNGRSEREEERMKKQRCHDVKYWLGEGNSGSFSNATWQHWEGAPIPPETQTESLDSDILPTLSGILHTIFFTSLTMRSHPKSM